MNVAVIPAKGVSERLPGKNMKSLAGEPLLKYTINVLKLSAYVDEIVVSSENDSILDYAEYMCCIPFRRDVDMATNDVMVWDVVKEVAVQYVKKKKNVRYFLEMHTTYPFRRCSTVDGAIEYCTSNGYEGVLVAKPVTDRLWRFIDDEVVRLADDIPVQDSRLMQPLFQDCYGLVNVYRPELILCGNPYLGRLGIFPSDYNLECLDIDTENDFAIADFMMRRRLKSYE